MSPAQRFPRLCLGIALAVTTAATAACTAGPAGSAGPGRPGSSGSGSGSGSVAASGARTSRPGTGRSPAATPESGPTPAPKPKPKLKPKPEIAPRVVLSTVHTPGGALVTVAVFRGRVTFVLHNGSLDPGYAASSKGVRAGPVVGRAERRRLLAAFNGGFKLGAGAGGYEQEGKLISPLVTGDASFIIDTDGRARIALWGHGAPARGEKVYSVRQNLGLLVSGGQPVPTAVSWWDWGATVIGSSVARSAVGLNSAGDIIYAASMAALPRDLAVALADQGARIAMELDINPEWVQLDVAARPGRPLRTAVPGQWRPADQFIVGWTRDFFTVLG